MWAIFAVLQYQGTIGSSYWYLITPDSVSVPAPIQENYYGSYLLETKTLQGFKARGVVTECRSRWWGPLTTVKAWTPSRWTRARSHEG